MLTDSPANVDIETEIRRTGRKAAMHACLCTATFLHPRTGKPVQCACACRTPHPSRICYLCRPDDAGVHHRDGGPAHTSPDTPLYRTTGLEWQRALRAKQARR